MSIFSEREFEYMNVNGFVTQLLDEDIRARDVENLQNIMLNAFVRMHRIQLNLNFRNSETKNFHRK